MMTMGRHSKNIVMQYALVNGTRSEPFSNGRGICPVCESEVIAKCGSFVVHHWAHAPNQKCDPWWENETAWHRDWKNKFPAECREIIHFAIDGEIHRADIKTTTGIVIEFQHSQLSDSERLSREVFYRNLVWVIDGNEFKDNFDIFHMLPSPQSELAKDIIWFKAKRHLNGAASGIFGRLSENPKFKTNPNSLVLLHSIKEIKEELEATYCGHHQYDWIRPRQTWLRATCPVYLDFGDDYLCLLENYSNYGLQCIRLVSKRKFIHDAMNEMEARSIATKFYPIV